MTIHLKVTDLEIIEQVPLNEERIDVPNNIPAMEKIKELLKKFKQEDQTYDFKKITNDDLEALKTLHSRLTCLDQIKFRLIYADLVEIPYPQLKDAEGFKFTKKSQSYYKSKTTVYYYCEAYKECPVGIKINFATKEKEYAFIEVIFLFFLKFIL